MNHEPVLKALLADLLAPAQAVEFLSPVRTTLMSSRVTVKAGASRLFVKFHDADRADMFEAEADALRALAEPGIIRIPEVICCGSGPTLSCLVLEYLDLQPAGDARRLGEGLAAIHSVTATHFGWHRDNTIGATPQVNSRCAGWIDFWRRHRLEYQLGLAAANGYPELGDQAEPVLHRLAEIPGMTGLAPSLLHGDLWSGNHAFLADGTPVIFDPASYFGDPDSDIAMTELFGGFGQAFYGAYRSVFPEGNGWTLRRDLYQLYHVINHLNLFGGGYAAQARSLIGRIRARLD